MLIDFTVENFRSIKCPVRLSAVAFSHRSNETDEKIAEPFRSERRRLDLLPVIGIFGPNASGKSNIISALGHFLNYHFFSEFPEISTGLHFATPYLLDPKSPKQPTRFELRVLREGIVYVFHLVLNRSQVLHERLEFIPRDSERSVTRLIYDRVWNEATNRFSVKNGRSFGNSFKKLQLSLKADQTFLSLLKNLDLELLNPLISWLSGYWTSLSFNNDLFDLIVASRLNFKRNDFRERVATILRKFDVGIEGIDIEELPDKKSGNYYKVWITRTCSKKEVRWELSEESIGTQKLFHLATRMLVAFEIGTLMLVDEFGASTHPNINREIVRLFQSKKFNKKGAQLIFVSHDVTLLQRGLLRRDQIWLTQVRDNYTELFSLIDFGIRNDLAIEKAYLDGRFGAVPFLLQTDGLEEVLSME